jgi:hypothetical protein
MAQERSSLVIEVRPGERLDIDGGRITLRLEEKIGQKARIRFECSKDIIIKRSPSNAAQMALRGVTKT